jgi:RecA/RadA recombinase
MSLFTEMLKATKNQDASIVADGVACGDVAGWLDSGSYSLNALISGSIYGGYPLGKATVMSGDPGAGKSFAFLTALKLFLDNNPTGFCFYFESESAISKDMFVSRGIDINRVAVLPVVTIQEFRHQCITILDKYEQSDRDKSKRPPMLMILDSLGMLSTTKEITDTAEGSETKDMTRNQIIKATFRVIALKLGRTDVPLLRTQHAYATMDQYRPREIGGGNSLKYVASTIIMLNKRKEKDGKDVIGNNIRAVAEKSRFTKEFSQAECLIDFETGLSRYYGLLEIAERCGAIVKEGVRYKLADGRLVYGKVINENPEEVYTKELLDKIDEGCKSIFGYGKGHDSSIESIEETIDKETGEII